MRELIRPPVLPLLLAVSAGFSAVTRARVLRVPPNARPPAAGRLAKLPHHLFEPSDQRPAIREIERVLIFFRNVSQLCERVDVQQCLKKVAVCLRLFGGHIDVLIVENHAEQKVHTWRYSWLFRQKVSIVGLNFAERRICGRANHAGVGSALVSEFLVYAVMQIVEPSVGGFAILEIARHEFHGAFAAETAGKDVLLSNEEAFLIRSGQIFGGD